MRRQRTVLTGAAAALIIVVGIVLPPSRSAAQGPSISGHVRYYTSGLPVPGVTVQLSGSTPMTRTTDAAGQYTFTNLGPGPWRVTPDKSGDLATAVSSLDALEVLQSVVGLLQPTAQEILACDVTANGTLSTSDALLILQIAVGLIQRLPVGTRCNSDWAFIPVPAAIPGQEMTPPNPTAAECQPGAITLGAIAGAATDQDFLAVLFGDCTGNWPGSITPTATPTATRTAVPTSTMSPSASPTLTRTPSRSSTPTPSTTRTPTPAPASSATVARSPTPTNTPIGGPWPQISLSTAYTGLSQPIYVTHAGDGTNRLFVVLQGGLIRLVKAGVLQTTPFLDIRTKVSCCGERGLLSVAFPPGYAGKRHFYVDYTDVAGNTVVARYRLTASDDVADATSEQIVLAVTQPFANHNGGQLQFGPDGYLYIGTGDGGSGGDPLNNAQNMSSLLGKLLRIDVEAASPAGTPTPYLIPSTNPTPNGTPGYRREIWASGLRNPWRFSFDRLTGDLYVGDVGQGAWEEIDFQTASSTGGQNYGWRIMEGTYCFNPNPCNTGGLTLPVWEYSHTAGDCSVTGGYVYRGATHPCMHGVYIYGDYCTGHVWGLKRVGSAWVNALLLSAPFNLTSFGEDEVGNLWVADYTNGAIRLLADACIAPTLTPTATPTATP